MGSSDDEKLLHDGGRTNDGLTRREPPLVLAKLKMPAQRPNAISRTRLEQRLVRIREHKVTLIEGAAGSGKTSLLAGYLAARPALHARCRWIALDAADDDVRTLWSYVLEAMKPELGHRAAELQQLLRATFQTEDTDTVLAEIVNHLQPDDDVFLILDDAHHLTDERVIESLQFFLRYCSERVHLILLSRENPALYLGEWRMAGQLLEIDNEHLKVNDEEARQFLTTTVGLPPDEQLLGRVIDLAEGWLGGLQLLGVALQHGRQQVASIQSLSHPAIEYLSEEILQAFPGDEQRFLVETSLLTHLHEDVCYAVTGYAESGPLLQRLFADNMFVVPVDEEHGLYRYHHLFREFLRQRVQQFPSEDRRQLHLRAARFYRRDVGLDPFGAALDECVHHYLQAEQYEELLDVITRARSSVHTWRLLQKVPLQALEGKTDLIFQRLFSHFAEQQLDRCAEVISHFYGRIVEPVAQTLFELFVGLLDNRPLQFDVDKWSLQDVKSLGLSSETEIITYAFLAMILSVKEQGREASACLHEVDRIMPRVENPYIRFYCLELKSQVKEYMGDLLECEAIYAAMFRLAEEHSFLTPIVPVAHVGVSGILLRAGRLADARAHLDEAQGRFGPGASLEIAHLYNELEFHVLTGDRASAESVVAALRQNDVLRHPLYCSPVLRHMLLLHVAADDDLAHFRFNAIDTPHWHDYLLHARLLARDDHTAEAVALVHERLSHLRKHRAKVPLVETLLLKAELLLEEARPHGGAKTTDDADASSGGADRLGGTASQPCEARDAVREAIHCSYENRLVAPFLVTPEPVRNIVRLLRGDPAAELSQLEAQFVDELVSRWPDLEDAPTSPVDDGLLSERETEVLHVLAEGATNKRIAERLYISVATVKTHVVNIYSKLGVSNRVEAVEEARRRGMIR